MKAGPQVCCASLAGRIDGLTRAERQDQRGEKTRFYTRASLLSVDETGCLPISQGGANLLFRLVNARYGKRAMILTANRDFAKWAEVFGDPATATALLDRRLPPAARRPDRKRQLQVARASATRSAPVPHRLRICHRSAHIGGG